MRSPSLEVDLYMYTQQLFFNPMSLPYLSSQNTPISHSKLSDVVDPVRELYDDVKRKCLLRLEYENQMKCEAITSPSSKFYQKPMDYSMSKYAYYVCFKCKKVCV